MLSVFSFVLRLHPPTSIQPPVLKVVLPLRCVASAPFLMLFCESLVKQHHIGRIVRSNFTCLHTVNHIRIIKCRMYKLSFAVHMKIFCISYFSLGYLCLYEWFVFYLRALVYFRMDLIRNERNVVADSPN